MLLYRLAFRKLDTDGSGTVSTEELHAAMRRIGMKCTSHEVEQMVDEGDSDGDRELSLLEFSGVMDNASRYRTSKAWLHAHDKFVGPNSCKLKTGFLFGTAEEEEVEKEEEEGFVLQKKTKKNITLSQGCCLCCVLCVCTPVYFTVASACLSAWFGLSYILGQYVIPEIVCGDVWHTRNNAEVWDASWQQRNMAFYEKWDASWQRWSSPPDSPLWTCDNNHFLSYQVRHHLGSDPEWELLECLAGYLFPKLPSRKFLVGLVFWLPIVVYRLVSFARSPPKLRTAKYFLREYKMVKLWSCFLPLWFSMQYAHDDKIWPLPVGFFLFLIMFNKAFGRDHTSTEVTSHSLISDPIFTYFNMLHRKVDSMLKKNTP